MQSNYGIKFVMNVIHDSIEYVKQNAQGATRISIGENDIFIVEWDIPSIFYLMNGDYFYAFRFNHVFEVFAMRLYIYEPAFLKVSNRWDTKILLWQDFHTHPKIDTIQNIVDLGELI